MVRRVLLATDADWLYNQVAASLAGPDYKIGRVSEGRAVSAAASEMAAEVVILDLQIGTMGGMAACIDLRHDEAMGHLSPTRALLLLDRDCDRWLARQVGADGWLIKPLDPLRLRLAIDALCGGRGFFEGEAVEGGSDGGGAHGGGDTDSPTAGAGDRELATSAVEPLADTG